MNFNALQKVLLLSCWVFGLVAGCMISRPCDRVEAFREPQSFPKCIAKDDRCANSRRIYQHVMAHQGNRVEQGIVAPWGPPLRRFVNPLIKNPAPYLAYSIYNLGLTYTKEALVLPLFYPLGGTRWQDDLDDWLYCHRLQYPRIYEAIWPEEPGHYVDYHNMDQYRPVLKLDSSPQEQLHALPSCASTSQSAKQPKDKGGK